MVIVHTYVEISSKKETAGQTGLTRQSLPALQAVKKFQNGELVEKTVSPRVLAG